MSRYPDDQWQAVGAYNASCTRLKGLDCLPPVGDDKALSGFDAIGLFKPAGAQTKDAEEFETPWVREMLLASPLNAPLAREENAEQVRLGSSRKQEVFAQLNTRDRTFAELLLAVPIDKVAALYGLTVRAVRYRQEEVLKQLGWSQYQGGQTTN